MRRILALVAAVVLGATIAGSISASFSEAATDRWVLRDLGTLGGKHSVALDVNSRGEVVGWALDQHGRPHGFVWRSGTMRKLPIGMATGINERGQILGLAAPGTPVVWWNGRTRAITTLGGPDEWGVIPVAAHIEWEIRLGQRTVPFGLTINDRGAVAGTSSTGDSIPAPEHGFVWRNGETTDLGTLPGGGASYVSAMNDRGQIVGSVDFDASVTVHGFLWQNGRMRDLGRGWWPSDINNRGQVVGDRGATSRQALEWHAGTLVRLGTSMWMAADVNERGVVAGSCLGKAAATSTRTVAAALPCLWRDGAVRYLVSPTGPTHGRALAVNERDELIGFLRHDYGAAVPFVWSGGSIAELGTLAGRTSEALAISDRSWVVGFSTTRSGLRHAVLWRRHPAG